MLKEAIRLLYVAITGQNLTAATLAEWAELHGLILDMYLFRTLSEVRVLTEDWRAEYNEERPHSSLGDMPPVIYARQKLAGDPHWRWY